MNGCECVSGIFKYLLVWQVLIFCEWWYLVISMLPELPVARAGLEHRSYLCLKLWSGCRLTYFVFIHNLERQKLEHNCWVSN